MSATTRRHVALFGAANAGKSTLFNALLGQQAAIVSPEPGTTTDPVIRAVELLGYGPVNLIDTAGLADSSSLGAARMARTLLMMERADVGVFVTDGHSPTPPPELPFPIPVITVVTKCDGVSAAQRRPYPDAIWMEGDVALDHLRERIIAELRRLDGERPPQLMEGLVPAGGQVLLITPLDSEAPTGRLILPQVQVLRACLDLGLFTLTVRETELSGALTRFVPDLAITDSNVFALVNALLPSEIPLTSFSMLLARQSGGFAQLLEGAERIKTLKNGDRVLITEGCTHNTSHEDIGRVMIPKALSALCGKRLSLTHTTGYDFPDDPTDFALVIQCGGCMTAPRALHNRLALLRSLRVPVTNYGMVLAMKTGILERTAAPILSAD